MNFLDMICFVCVVKHGLKTKDANVSMNTLVKMQIHLDLNASASNIVTSRMQDTKTHLLDVKIEIFKDAKMQVFEV